MLLMMLIQCLITHCVLLKVRHQREASYNAAAPATCGEAMLDPLIVAYEFPFVSRIYLGSRCCHIYNCTIIAETCQCVIPSKPVLEPIPPHLPSLSPMAETAITLGLLAGENVEASFPEFPEATTNVIPAFTALFIAVSNAEDLHSQPRLRLATSI